MQFERLESTFGESERGVSPVIGVILMVAITVILAAVIATFVMGLGGQTQANPQAGVSFTELDNGDVRVQLTSKDRADTVTVNPGGNKLIKVGESVTATPNSNGEVTVIATYNGKTAVVGTYTA